MKYLSHSEGPVTVVSKPASDTTVAHPPTTSPSKPENNPDTIIKPPNPSKPKDKTSQKVIKAKSVIDTIKKCKIYFDTDGIANVTITLSIDELDSTKISNALDKVVFWVREDYTDQLIFKINHQLPIRCDFKCGNSDCYSLTSREKN